MRYVGRILLENIKKFDVHSEKLQQNIEINMPSFVSIGIICYPSYHSTFSLLLYVGVASVLGRSCHDVGCPLHLLPPRLASDWVRQLGGHPLCPHTCPSTANPAWLCAGIYWAVGGWVGASFYSYPFFLTRSHFDCTDPAQPTHAR